MLPTVEESQGDFQETETEEKWRGLFIPALRKVLDQVHPNLNAEENALYYVETLCLRLLNMLCGPPSPLTVQDVEERVARTFPTPLDKWALADARDAVSQRRRRSLLPIDRTHHHLQKEVLLYKIDTSVSVFITAILEYVSADILKLAGNYVKKISQKSGYETITSRDIKTAMCADKVLMDMFYQDTELAAIEAAGCAGGVGGAGGEWRGRRGSLTYAELVRDLLTDEKHFLRELNLIIRVFKDELEKILDKDSRTISLIFGNIVDIYELTVTLLGNLEDAMEMSQDSPTPYIGSCFEELAEVEEFRAYVRYANIVTRKESRDALQAIVDDPLLAERLDTAGHGFRLAVKYYLPKLLLAPVAHVFLYHKYVLALLQIAPASDDRESFKQVECNLHPIKKLLVKVLENGPKMDATLRMATRARRQLAIEKCNELARLVDNWDNRDIGQCCNEFIREDTLSKIGPGKKVAERRAYLFDGLLLLCKPSATLVGVNAGTLTGAGGAGGGGGGGGGAAGGAGAGGAPAGHQLKLKEKLHIRKLDLVDRPDNDETRHLVELVPRVGPAVVLACGSAAEQRRWMCDLVMLNTKPMLDRSLDSILLDLERRHPLRLPPPHLYRFAEPDGPHNLLLEERPRHAAPLLKGATLLKLVERLTYHIYADLNLVRTFLTTYRSFCSPAELLDLLIERFNIPEPSEVYDAPRPVARTKPVKKDISPNSSLLDIDMESIESVARSDVDKLQKNTAREDWKRYRKEFQQPVKFRVINVIRHWVDQHFYDFERDPELLERLRRFLESVDGKPMRKWVQSVLKIIQRKSEVGAEAESGAGGGGGGGGGVAHVFDRKPPAVVRHPADIVRLRGHPLAFHPLELARQLTLWESQLFRQVRPSELVGAVWTGRDKHAASPNLLRIIRHTTGFTRWAERWLVESENLEERAAVLCRLLELAVALRDLNNFNGVLAVVAACGSASVHRLKATFQLVPPRLLRALEQFRELNSDHFRRYQEQLRSINPPCVPFFGMYLTNILHIEEGNLDFLPNSELINFSKRRKVAEITGEIQQYQNQPYCLTVEPVTRAFLETLDPFPGMDDTEITNYLYAKSLEIEPRLPVKQMPKFPRKYPELSLKPVKVSRRHHDHHNNSITNTITNSVSNSTMADDTISVSQLSPTGSSWDGQSVASLSLHDERGWRSSGGGDASSPRSERSGNSLSLLSLFDKAKAATAGRNCSKEEPPSPRDRHSPRHDRQPSCGGAAAATAATAGGAGGGGGCPPDKKPALSPRAPTADGDLFYSRPPTEEVPPLLPRSASSVGSVCSVGGGGGGECATNAAYTCAPRSELPAPPAPPDRPLPSPKHADFFRMPGTSPKRSPAPQPPPSPPHDRGGAFKFPSRSGSATPSPSSHPQPQPHPHPPPLTPHPPASCGTPPPLPPRRRRDSTAPSTPHHHHHNHHNNHNHQHSTSQPGGEGEAVGGAGVGVGGAGGPPPLPPRPPAAPPLLRPSQSAILQRRNTEMHSAGAGGAPRLPPKPAVGVGGAGGGAGGAAGGGGTLPRRT